MTILLVLIPISLILLGIAIGAFAWAVRGGQFDDLQTPAIAILADDRGPCIPAAPAEVGSDDAAPAAQPPHSDADRLA